LVPKLRKGEAPCIKGKIGFINLLRRRENGASCQIARTKKNQNENEQRTLERGGNNLKSNPEIPKPKLVRRDRKDLRRGSLPGHTLGSLRQEEKKNLTGYHEREGGRDQLNGPYSYNYRRKYKWEDGETRIKCRGEE